MSEALKSNTSLTNLDLSCEDRRKKTRKRHPSTVYSFSFLFSSTVNKIRDTSAESFSDSLKSNTTLTDLDLSCEDKRKKTQKTSTNNSLFSLHRGVNGIGEES